MQNKYWRNILPGLRQVQTGRVWLKLIGLPLFQRVTAATTAASLPLADVDLESQSVSSSFDYEDF